MLVIRWSAIPEVGGTICETIQFLMPTGMVKQGDFTHWKGVELATIHRLQQFRNVKSYYAMDTSIT